MPQGILSYKYEEEKTTSGMTAIAGLPVYLDLAPVLNLGESITTHLQVKVQGWTDEQVILSLILLNLAGGSPLTTFASLKPMKVSAGYLAALS